MLGVPSGSDHPGELGHPCSCSAAAVLRDLQGQAKKWSISKIHVQAQSLVCPQCSWRHRLQLQHSSPVEGPWLPTALAHTAQVHHLWAPTARAPRRAETLQSLLVLSGPQQWVETKTAEAAMKCQSGPVFCSISESFPQCFHRNVEWVLKKYHILQLLLNKAIKPMTAFIFM